jgi:hypothetical protein
MAYTSSTAGLLEQVEKHVLEYLDRNWVAEPPAARAALLVREELGRWTQATYPGSSIENSSLDPASRRSLSLRIHSAPVTHRVEVWGMACGDESEKDLPKGGHIAHSWVVLAHVGKPCPRIQERAEALRSAGLARLESRETPRLSLSLWSGSAAPDGCPACQETE